MKTAHPRADSRRLGAARGGPASPGFSGRVAAFVTQSVRSGLLLLAVASSLFVNPTASAQVKWNPGHYMLVGEPEHPVSSGGWPADYDTGPDGMLANPAIVGVQLRYRWKDLEPTKDNSQPSHSVRWFRGKKTARLIDFCLPATRQG